MDITQTLAQTPPAAITAPERAAITSDFQTFLTMLTAQMQNQDPLNPIESTDFATQLATFSGVEQQVRTNDLLGALGTQMSMMGIGQLTGWIGMEARAEMPIYFDGAPQRMIATPDAGADRMELVVRNDRAEIVQRLAVPVSDRPFTWDGTGPDGTPLPWGIYSFATVASVDGQPQPERPVQTFARIEEAVLQEGETWLTMAGGTSIPASSVLAIRNP